MAKAMDNVVKGGSFLIEEVDCGRVFTPEDFTDEHKMIAKTTEEFVINEVLPQLEHLENHEFDRSVKLLKKAGEIGLLSADVPEEYGGLSLDKISSALIAEKMARAGGVFDFAWRPRRNRLTSYCIIWNRSAKTKIFAGIGHR